MAYLISYIAFAIVMLIVAAIYKAVNRKMGRTKGLRLDVNAAIWAVFCSVMAIWLPYYLIMVPICIATAIFNFFIIKKSKKFIAEFEKWAEENACEQ